MINSFQQTIDRPRKIITLQNRLRKYFPRVHPKVWIPRDGANRADRFNAKCRRVLHAAIMVEIYVANISRATLSLPSRHRI